jgi:hypothetical protein
MRDLLGIAVFYKSDDAVYLVPWQDADGTIRNFVSPQFKPDGHAYRQLTPDGVLR